MIHELYFWPRCHVFLGKLLNPSVRWGEGRSLADRSESLVAENGS